MKWILVLSFLFLSACQTNQLKQYSEIREGMDKDDVLELMGPPQHKLRWKGMDRWTYRFYGNNTLHIKDVHFNQGTVVYVGDPPQPSPSAAEQDAMNEKENQELDARDKENKVQAEQALENYQEKKKGQTRDAHVPQFHPVN